MAILNLEDLSGTVEVVVFPDLYKTAHHLLLTDTPLIVAGQLDKSEQGNKIKAVRIHLLTEVKKKGTTRMDITLQRHGPDPGRPPQGQGYPSPLSGRHPRLSPPPEPHAQGFPHLRGQGDPREPHLSSSSARSSPCSAPALSRWYRRVLSQRFPPCRHDRRPMVHRYCARSHLIL